MEQHKQPLKLSTNQSQMDGKDSSKSNNQLINKDLNKESLIPIGMINKAITGKRILDSTDSEIAKRLSLIYFMIGLRPHHFPTKEEDVFLFSYIRKNYPNTTLDEIYLAFDLAIKNVLDVSDIKCYDQFSIEYFVRIMTGYYRYAKNIISNEPRKKVELRMFEFFPLSPNFA